MKSSVIRAPAAAVFAFHERPDALERLTPPWQRIEIVQPPASLAIGTRVILRTRVGFVPQTIVAEHVEYEAGRMFADRMVRGPFARWLHRHVVTPIDAQSCTLTDDVDYQLPLGALGRLFGSGYARRQLDRLFEYRHAVTKKVCEAHRSESEDDAERHAR